MSDGSYSILLTFLSLQTQYTVRNVGVFQFSTQNISWHRLCHRAFSEGKRKRNNIYCVRSMCMCAQYSQFHTFNTCTMCLVFVGWSFCSSNVFLHHHSTNEQSHVYAYTTTATIKWRLFVLIFSICFLFLFGSAQFGLILFFGNGYYYFIFHLKNYNFTKNFCIQCWQHDQFE